MRGDAATGAGPATEAPPSIARLLSGLLDPDSPERCLDIATQIAAAGVESWIASSGERRARSLGLSPRQARRLRYCAQLVEQADRESWAQPAPISGPQDVLAHLGDIRESPREQVVALYVDSRNRPLHRELVAVGGLRASVIQPRDVLAPALAIPAAALILAHNHPSGDTRPSAEDIEITQQLAAAARLLGLELLDHLVVSRRGYCSMKESGAI